MSLSDVNPYDCPAPPDPQRVARRALVLSAIVCRSNIDHDPANPDAIGLWDRLKSWIESLDVASEIEPAEKEMIYASLGTLEHKKRIRSEWHAEGLGILGWALRRFPFPKYDEMVDPYELADCLGFLSEDAGAIIQNAELRPREELKACRELFYAIHCRARGFKRDGGARSVAAWIEPGWLKTLGMDSPLGQTGDIRIGSVEIASAEGEKVNRYEWAVSERHRAIIWLVGEAGPIYSLVPVDT